MCDANIGPGIDNYSPSPSAAIIERPEEIRYRQSLYYMDKEKPNIFQKIIKGLTKITVWYFKK